MNRFDELKKGYGKSLVAADEVRKNHQRAAKMPIIQAVQRGEITREEYADLVGEPFEVSIKEIYDLSIARAKMEVANRVALGHLTAEEYRSITGEDYVEEETA